MNDAHHRLFEEAKAQAEDRVESGLQRYHISLSPTLFLILCAEREKSINMLRRFLALENDQLHGALPLLLQCTRAVLREIE